MRRVDAISGVTALALHAGIAAAMFFIPPHIARSSTIIDVELKPPPPKITQPEPPPPEPEKKIIPKVKVQPPPEVTPPPNREPPKEVPKEPPKPVFGMNNDSVVDSDSTVSMPTGNTTMIDPSKSGKGGATPLPAGTPGPAKAEYKPIADLYVKSLPEIDAEECARKVTYPPEAEQLGIEGQIKLRVALDETGKVHDIKVLTRLGHGLEDAAVNALKYKCKFKPAYGTDGKPAPYVIQAYVWTFELPR